jgi:hypothetical protein
MNPFDDFKIVDGVKLFRSECVKCGNEFFSKNPYKTTCEDKEKHKKIKMIEDERTSINRLCSGRKPLKSGEWSGSFDNAVKICEQ